MGLDMYLYKATYIGGDYGHRNVTGEAKLEARGRGYSWDATEINEIHCKAAYWRKDNHIHKWFVDKIQGGNDDCGSYEVSSSDLEELVALCEELLEERDPDPAREKLPTQDGFFFGSTEYGDYYWDSLEETVSMLKAALADERVDWFIYRSSW